MHANQHESRSECHPARGCGRVVTFLSLLCGGLSLSLVPGCGGQTELPGPASIAPGYCAKACSVTADCCPSADPDCPGEYPSNFACDEGLCRAPRCETDAHCSFLSDVGGAGEFVCRVLDGSRGCMRACATDDDCGAAAGGLSAGACSGTADDGTRICRIPTGLSNLGCKTDDDCPTGRHCQSGMCGCETNVECQPELDVCTKDRAFEYPHSAAPAPG